MNAHTRLAVALLALSMSASLALAANRPEAGHGGIFVDDVNGLYFSWTDFDGDFLQVFWPQSSPADFARMTPNGKKYVHAMSEDVAIFAMVEGISYTGRGTYQTSYFANCTVFDPSARAFNCFIGPGPASMNANGSVTSGFTGQECTLSAHMALFFLFQRACDAVTGGDPSCFDGALFGANDRQFDIKVSCGG